MQDVHTSQGDFPWAQGPAMTNPLPYCTRCELLEIQRDLYARERDRALADLDASKKLSPAHMRTQIERLKLALDMERQRATQLERALSSIEAELRAFSGRGAK